MKCCYCGNEFEADDLRPYGPNGASTCHPCATGTPERKAVTLQMMATAFATAGRESADGVVMIGSPSGPMPLNPRSKA